MLKKIYTILGLFCFISVLNAQEAWEIPQAEKENISIVMFNEDIVKEGEAIYNNSCISCHGTPTKENFVLMSPPPGDIATVKFQNQLDGEIFYKIKSGRGLMPKFVDAFGQDEIWKLVAYIRSFNEDYVQPIPNMEGVVVPDINLVLSYDENIDKLVVKTFDENSDPMLGVDVKAYIKGTFGDFLLGKEVCNEMGIAYFDIDSKMPGDKQGNLEIIVKASKGVGTVKVTEVLQVVEPVVHINILDGRHLWSVSKSAPLWLKFSFYFTIIGIWGAIIYILFGLIKLKKYS